MSLIISNSISILYSTTIFFEKNSAYPDQNHFLAGFSFLTYGAAAGFSAGFATTGAFFTGAALTTPALF